MLTLTPTLLCQRLHFLPFHPLLRLQSQPLLSPLLPHLLPPRHRPLITTYLIPYRPSHKPLIDIHTPSMESPDYTPRQPVLHERRNRLPFSTLLVAGSNVLTDRKRFDLKLPRELIVPGILLRPVEHNGRVWAETDRSPAHGRVVSIAGAAGCAGTAAAHSGSCHDVMA